MMDRIWNTFVQKYKQGMDEWRSLFSNKTSEELADEGKKNEAAKILGTCLKDQATEMNENVRIWDAVHARFLPYKLGGYFNLDAKLQLLQSQGATVNTLTSSFLKSLRDYKEFKKVDKNMWISMAAFIDLARCPAVFCLDNQSLRYLLNMVCKRPGQETKACNAAFKEWLQNNPPESESVEDEYYEKANYIYNTTELVRASLMQLKACFSLVALDSTSAERQEIQTFFNMDYSEWLKLLVEQHSSFPEYNTPTKMNGLVFSLQMEKEVKDAITINHAMAAEFLGMDFGRKAQQLDLYYANLVHGAAIKVPLGEIWCPSNELEHSDRDTDKFFEVMWKNLKEMLKKIMSSSTAVNSKGMVEYTNSLIKSIKSVRDIKRYMKEIWEESKMYRISDRVHMVEVQILQRLKADGVFQWFDSEGQGPTTGGTAPRAQNLHVCFFMRRCIVFFKCMYACGIQATDAS
jgi:hypothetical protein